MTIDSHQHFWNYNPVRDAWINDEMSVIRKDFVPAELSEILKENLVEGCIAIQADQSEDETHFLVTCAEKNSFVKGVVGWVDLCSGKIAGRLEYFSQFKIVKGFRHIIQGEQPGFMNQKSFRNGIRQLAQYRLTYDILVYPHQLQEAFDFVKEFPNQNFVIDHLAKPVIREGEFGNWSKGIAKLCKCENVYCKLSGFTTEANWKNWKPGDFTRYFDSVLECFGANRLMYGSDWPVCLLAATYQQQLDVVRKYISKLSPGERTQIMGGNAMKFYL